MTFKKIYKKMSRMIYYYINHSLLNKNQKRMVKYTCWIEIIQLLKLQYRLLAVDVIKAMFKFGVPLMTVLVEDWTHNPWCTKLQNFSLFFNPLYISSNATNSFQVHKLHHMTCHVTLTMWSVMWCRDVGRHIESLREMSV